jgi:O-succinylbenzoate synthase
VTLTAVALWAYALPLTRPLAARNDGIRREGLILCLTDDQGHRGWGEAAPLPAHGSETLAAAKAGLARLPALVGRTLPDNGAVLDRIAAMVTPLGLGPAACCAAEAALASLVAARTGRALHRLIGEAAVDRAPVAGLIDRGGTPSGAAAAARTLAEAGHGTIKLKVGAGSAAEEAAVVAAVTAAAPGVALRLDANRAWTATTARDACLRLAATGACIDYIEEPLAAGDCLAAAPLPQALDETLVALGPRAALARLDAEPRPAAIILKPTLLGFVATIRLMRAARARGIAPVISSSFESGLGLRLAAAIAASSGTVAGLGTAPWFARDTLGQPEPAAIDLTRPLTPDLALLEPLDVAA